MLPEVFRLKNNIRLIYQPSGGSKVTHMALMVNAGTRNEGIGKEGLAHFIEHVFFKGTERRRSFHILNRLDSVGGELNAFTSKEETCLYASVMNEHTERAMELLSDVFFNSVFPEKELTKEKMVILDEIRTYEDTPSEQILDDFERMIFHHHSLGNPVLGTLESIGRIKRQDVINFIRANYSLEKTVLSVVSNMPVSRVKLLAEKYFSGRYNRKSAISYKKISPYKKNEITLERPISQSHIVIGNRAYSYYHRYRYAMALLNNILGGPGMNSRLNLNIREKFGYAYQIDSNYIPYSDTGIFNIYFATDFRNVEKTTGLVYKELDKLRNQKIKNLQLKKYKEQMIGQVLLSFENKAGLTFSAAKSLLCFNKIDTPSQINRSIQSVTAEQLIEVANEIFDKNNMSILHFKPSNNSGSPQT